MSTDTLERPVVAPTDHDGAHRAHIVNCPDDKASTAAWLTEARVFGLEVTALCGHKWVPERNPDRYPVCQACIDAANQILNESETS